MARHAAHIILVTVTAATAALALVSGGSAASRPFAPVPSLDAPATEKQWRRLVRHAQAPSALQACAATTYVSFYAATDWMRLATSLAATPAPCAEVYVSVPPLAADKTQLRADQAWRIRALGSAFHALAEINYTGWSTWVASGAGTWYDAGVEARRRMAAAGFDAALGDRWALNEISSAVRAGTGNARANVRELLRGLHDGPPGSPAVRGVAFVAGIGQRTSELSVYQARLQDWLEDGAFWQEMSSYVDDWAQEQYGDVRAYAVPGADLETRRARLADYLEHDRLLALAEPGSAAAARAFLASAHAPVANAAWRFDASFGWTDVSIDLMEDYLSAQVDALRAFGAVRYGFAWSPRNPGMPTADFASQTGALLRRLAEAIADPAGGCTPSWCVGVLDGASFNLGWQAFRTWRPSQLAFVSPAPALQPGAASPPLAVELRTFAGVLYDTGRPLEVTFTTSSPTGSFAPGPDGPWTNSLTFSLPVGSRTAAAHYQDTQPGAPVLMATAAGRTPASLSVTVGAPPPPVQPPVQEPTASPPAEVPSDTSAPDTVITSAPSGLLSSAAATVAFASEPDARFECSLDAGPFTGCTSPLALSRLPQGQHWLEIRAVDTVGNADQTPSRATWVVDTVPPRTRIASFRRPTPWSASFRFATNEERPRFECSLDGRAFAKCESAKGYRSLAAGRHTLRVRATDRAGNRDATPASRTWSAGTARLPHAPPTSAR